MASLFSQKALINVVGGKVPEVAKSQITRQRPLTTVFYALNILDVSLSRVSCHTYTHTHNVFFACAALLSSCLCWCLRGEEGEQSL